MHFIPSSFFFKESSELFRQLKRGFFKQAWAPASVARDNYWNKTVPEIIRNPQNRGA
jgi:hypothetical protein